MVDNAVGHGRIQLIDAGNAGDGILDLFGHLHLEFGRRRTRLGDSDSDNRHIDVGKPGDRHVPEGLKP